MRLLYFVLLTFILQSCVSSSMDLGYAKNTRHWVKLCTASKDDIYCKAVYKIIGGSRQDFVLLHPNASSRDVTQAIKNLYPSSYNNHLDQIARANLFLITDLKTGQITSLDGKSRNVNCVAAGNNCTIDNLIGSKFFNDREPEKFGGMIYQTTNKDHKKPKFLLP